MLLLLYYRIKKTSLVNENGDISIKKNKCLSELDDVHEANNVDAAMRCQLWDIVSSLEQL